MAFKIHNKTIVKRFRNKEMHLQNFLSRLPNVKMLHERESFSSQK